MKPSSEAVRHIASGSGQINCFKKINKDPDEFITIKENFVSEYKTLVSNPRVILEIGWQPRVDFFNWPI